jgi:NAD(P)-dependent dehydrogenase (short-subunit alcohol dehydrogenase family)
MAVDGRGMFLTCKYAIEEMLKTGWLYRVPLLDLGPRQTAAASGLRPGQVRRHRADKRLAVEWAERGIRVNAVAPGTILTEAVAELPDEYKESMLKAHH